jgi:DNA-binding MarR family transcriptional regulator
MPDNPIENQNLHSDTFIPQNRIEVTDQEKIQFLVHKDKQLLLRLLILQEHKIIELQNECQMNPGTIKRHIDDLVSIGLVVVSRVSINRKNIKEKYYRASALQYVVKFVLP